MHLFLSYELVEIERRPDRAQSQAVRFGHIVDIVRCDHRARPWHVLSNHIGIALNMFPHMSCEHAGPNIVPVAGLITHSDGDCFALIVWSLRVPRLVTNSINVSASKALFI